RQRGGRPEAARLGRRAAAAALRGGARHGQPAGGGIRREASAGVERRPEAAGRRRAGHRRGSAGPPDGPALRRARPDRPARPAAGVPGLEGAPEEGGPPRHARHAGGVSPGRPDRGDGPWANPASGHEGGAPRAAGRRLRPRIRLGGFLSRPSDFRERRAEILALTGQHVVLVAVSTLLASAIGIPLGIVLARRPALARPVLGIAAVVQTIPSLALFGFLLPLPLIGGIGARTAIVALPVLPILPPPPHPSPRL